MKLLSIAGLLTILAACAGLYGKVEGDTWSLGGFRVAAVSSNPQPSGILSTLVEIEAADVESGSQTLYLQYYGGDQFIPNVGMNCDADGKFAFINGSSTINSPIRRGVLHRVVDELSCQ